MEIQKQAEKALVAAAQNLIEVSGAAAAVIPIPDTAMVVTFGPASSAGVIAAQRAQIAELTACVAAHQRSLIDHAKMRDANLVEVILGAGAGSPVSDGLRNARAAIQRAIAQLSILHEDREPIMASIIATVALILDDDLETVAKYLATPAQPIAPAADVSAPTDERAASDSDSPETLIGRLLEYAGNPGYSHNDYADTMRDAVDALEGARAKAIEDAAKACEQCRPVSREECPDHWKHYEKSWSMRELVANECAYRVRALAARAAARVNGAGDEITWDQSVLLAGIQALCIAADQELSRRDGSLSEFDKGWFLGQLHIFDMYTPVEKGALNEAREYLRAITSAQAPQQTMRSLYEIHRDAAESAIGDDLARLMLVDPAGKAK